MEYRFRKGAVLFCCRPYFSGLTADINYRSTCIELCFVRYGKGGVTLEWLYNTLASYESGSEDHDYRDKEAIIQQQVDMNAYLMQNRITQDDPNVRQYKSKQFRYAVAQTIENEEETRSVSLDRRG